jgi:hypothetical protein
MRHCEAARNLIALRAETIRLPQASMRANIKARV